LSGAVGSQGCYKFNVPAGAKRLSIKMAKKIEGVSKRGMDVLVGYSWPGNIRELENALERGMIMAQGNVIGPEDLPLNTTDGDKAGLEQLTTLEELEKKLIEKTLTECNWNKTLAARRIGIGRRTLYDKATRYGIPIKPNGE
jgi:DNA-binding NtrC family response regulator